LSTNSAVYSQKIRKNPCHGLLRNLAVERVGGYNAGPILGYFCVDNPGRKAKGPGLLLISVGTVLTSMIAAGFLLGYLLDVWLDTLPILMLVCGALGFIGGILKVYRLLTDPRML
jgi:ATP synthase protein I